MVTVSQIKAVTLARQQHGAAAVPWDSLAFTQSQARDRTPGPRGAAGSVRRVRRRKGRKKSGASLSKSSTLPALPPLSPKKASAAAAPAAAAAAAPQAAAEDATETAVAPHPAGQDDGPGVAFPLARLRWPRTDEERLALVRSVQRSMRRLHAFLDQHGTLSVTDSLPPSSAVRGRHGFVSAPAVCAWLRSLRSERAAPAAPRAPTARPRRRDASSPFTNEAFEVLLQFLDADGSGQVDLEEILHAFRLARRVIVMRDSTSLRMSHAAAEALKESTLEAPDLTALSRDFAMLEGDAGDVDTASLAQSLGASVASVATRFRPPPDVSRADVDRLFDWLFAGAAPHYADAWLLKRKYRRLRRTYNARQGVLARDVAHELEGSRPATGERQAMEDDLDSLASTVDEYVERGAAAGATIVLRPRCCCCNYARPRQLLHCYYH